MNSTSPQLFSHTYVKIPKFPGREKVKVPGRSVFDCFYSIIIIWYPSIVLGPFEEECGKMFLTSPKTVWIFDFLTWLTWFIAWAIYMNLHPNDYGLKLLGIKRICQKQTRKMREKVWQPVQDYTTSSKLFFSWVGILICQPVKGISYTNNPAMSFSRSLSFFSVL